MYTALALAHILGQLALSSEHSAATQNQRTKRNNGHLLI